MLTEPNDSVYWSATDISDVHVYIGGIEVAFDGEVGVWVMAPSSSSEGSIEVSLAGQIGSGSNETYRSLLSEGTVSFRVHSGDVNAIMFSATVAEAEIALPTPTTPDILNDSNISWRQYDRVLWVPSISWGWLAGGTYEITNTNLPLGVYIGETNDGALALLGQVPNQGEFSFEVSATNSVGTTTKAFTLSVGPSVAKPHYNDGLGTLTRNANSSLSLHLRNAYDAVYRDNATIQQWMPALDEAGIGIPGQWGYEKFMANDVHLYLASGAEIPITGSFEVEMWTGSHISLRSSIMTIGNNTNAAITDVWRQATRITFRRGSGQVNEFWKNARPLYVLS